MTSLPEGNPTVRDDSSFGSLALRHGHLSPQQLGEGLREQHRLRAAGTPRRIGEILIALGYLSPAHFVQLLAEQGQGLRVCVACGRVYDRAGLPETEPPPCPGCGAGLAPIGVASPPPAGKIGGDLAATRTSASPGPPCGGDAGPSGGLSFGRYSLRSKVARGGMGQVWRAWDPDLGRIVALKHVLAASADLPEVCARFLREARLAARLRHPHIVPIFDVGTQDGLPYLTMECVEGRTFAEFLEERGALKRRGERAGFERLREEVLLLAEIAEAVAYAHREGVIHRDLKPGNVLVDEAGRPRILDFGLARELHPPLAGDGSPADHAAETRADAAPTRGGAAPLTQSGEVLGTPGYMSPEQVEGDLAALGPGTDVWALGVMLYETLTGESPFPGDGAMKILWGILHSDPVPPRRRNPHASPDLEAVCLQAMEKEPSARYATAMEFAEELRRWLAGIPVRAVRPGPLRRAWRGLVRRRGVAIPLAGACLLAIAAVTLAAHAERRSEARARTLLARVGAAAGRFEDRVRSLALTLEARRALAEQPLELLDALVADDPGFGPAWSWRGRVQVLLGRDREGAADLDAGIERSPGHAAVWFLRGLHRLERYAAARGEPDLKTGANGLEFLPMRAETDAERAAREGGLADLARAEAAARTDPLAGEEQTALARALAMLYSGRPDGAREAAEILAGRGGARAASLRGTAAFRLGRFAVAVGEFERARAAWPEDPDVRLVLGQAREATAMALAAEGQDPRPTLVRTLEDYDAVLARVPGHTLARLKRGGALLTLGHAEHLREGAADEALTQALAAYEEILREAPGLERARVNRAIAAMLLGDRAAHRGEDPRPRYGEAIADCDAALARQPDLLEALANRGKARWRLGRNQATRGEDPRPALALARADFEAVVQRDPSALAHSDCGNVLMAIAEVAERVGEAAESRYREALREYDEALRLAPAFVLAYPNRTQAQLAIARLEAGRGLDPRPSLREAVERLLEARRSNPLLSGIARSLRLARVALAEAEDARGGAAPAAWEGALAAFDDDARENPRDDLVAATRGLAWRSLALARAARGEDSADAWKRAEQDLTAARSLGASGAALDLGQLYAALGRYEEAAVAFAAVPELPPDRKEQARGAEADMRRKAALVRQGGWAAELTAANQLHARGEAHTAGEHYREALRLFYAAVAGGPKSEQARVLGDVRVRSILAETYYTFATIRCLAAAGKAGPAADPRPVAPEEAARCRDEAFQLLDRAREWDLPDPQRLRSDPRLEPLRSDSRWPEWIAGAR